MRVRYGLILSASMEYEVCMRLEWMDLLHLRKIFKKKPMPYHIVAKTIVLQSHGYRVD